MTGGVNWTLITGSKANIMLMCGEISCKIYLQRTKSVMISNMSCKKVYTTDFRNYGCHFEKKFLKDMQQKM